MSKLLVVVKVDDREDSQFKELLLSHEWELKKHEVIVVEKRLEEGDIQVFDGTNGGGIIGCYERKNRTTEDDFNSIKDGRVFDECERVSNSGAIYFGIILEGTRHMKPRLEFGAQLSLHRDHKPHIVETKDMEDTIKFIESVIYKVGKTPSAKHKEQKKDITPQEYTINLNSMLFTRKQIQNIQKKYHFFHITHNKLVDILRGAYPLYTHISRGKIDTKSLSSARLKGFKFSWKPHENSSIVDLCEVDGIGPVSVKKAICRLMGDPTYCDWENLKSVIE